MVRDRMPSVPRSRIPMPSLCRLLVAATASFTFAAFATEAPRPLVEPASLYEVKTECTTAKVAPGEKAKLVISIVAKNGAHVSDEAPLKIELSGTNATPEKKRLTLADSLEKKAQGQKYPKPVFEATYTTAATGKATL